MSKTTIFTVVVKRNGEPCKVRRTYERGDGFVELILAPLATNINTYSVSVPMWWHNIPAGTITTGGTRLEAIRH